MQKIESEKLLEKKLSTEVKKLGGWTIKLLPYIVNGLPDRLILLHGRAYFAELKTTGKRLRPDQILMKSKLEKLGFKVYVIDSAEQINELINEITI